MRDLTGYVRKQLPELNATPKEEWANPMLVVKFFYPDFSWTWYGIEFDGRDVFYGYVEGDYNELGYFSLMEIMGTRGKLGCEIERDLHFRPRRLSEIRKD